MVGYVIGHFLANYSQYKKADAKMKKKILGNAAMLFAKILGRKIIDAIPVFKNNTAKGNIFRYGFLAINS